MAGKGEEANGARCCCSRVQPFGRFWPQERNRKHQLLRVTSRIDPLPHGARSPWVGGWNTKRVPEKKMINQPEGKIRLFRISSGICISRAGTFATALDVCVSAESYKVHEAFFVTKVSQIFDV